ncbi:MAG: hypothetical protein N3I35_17360 [Clostridia bacterium]|nr:hypothetical protein [Clostridia bacterium]
MSKTIAIAIVIISVLLIALGGFFIFEHFYSSHSTGDIAHTSSDTSSQEKISPDSKVLEDSKNLKDENTQPQASESDKQKTFTKEDLAKYNGKDGQPCYVALYGVVYDITNVKGWKNGSHGHGILGGKDWTAAFDKLAPKSHKNPDFLKKLPVVGVYVGERSTEIPKQLDKH